MVNLQNNGMAGFLLPSMAGYQVLWLRLMGNRFMCPLPDYNPNVSAMCLYTSLRTQIENMGLVLVGFAGGEGVPVQLGACSSFLWLPFRNFVKASALVFCIVAVCMFA